jgi:hypothetical protein
MVDPIESKRPVLAKFRADVNQLSPGASLVLAETELDQGFASREGAEAWFETLGCEMRALPEGGMVRVVRAGRG